MRDELPADTQRQKGEKVSGRGASAAGWPGAGCCAGGARDQADKAAAHRSWPKRCGLHNFVRASFSNQSSLPFPRLAHLPAAGPLHLASSPHPPRPRPGQCCAHLLPEESLHLGGVDVRVVEHVMQQRSDDCRLGAARRRGGVPSQGRRFNEATHMTARCVSSDRQRRQAGSRTARQHDWTAVPYDGRPMGQLSHWTPRDSSQETAVQWAGGTSPPTAPLLKAADSRPAS